MKKKFLSMALSVLFYISNAQSVDLDKDDCNAASQHCWPTVWLSEGLIACDAQTTPLNEDFRTLDSWNRHLGRGATEVRINVPCEEQLYLDGNVSLIPDPLNQGQNLCRLTGLHQTSQWNGLERRFSSGAITTRQGYAFGRYEVTIRDMPGRGWWPAFWMWHHDEIDIMERFHGDRYSYNCCPANNECKTSNEYKLDPLLPSIYDGPHTFSVEWTPFKLTFFYNGIALPNVIYRYYNYEGTPMNWNCGSTILAGYYRLNPNFPETWHDFLNNGVWMTESTTFAPIINLAVLPLSGMNCCDDANGTPNVFCYNNIPPNNNCPDANQCEALNWGNPLYADGTVREIPPQSGEEPWAENTTMDISNVRVVQQRYITDNIISIVKDSRDICVDDTFSLWVEDLTNTSWSYQKQILNVNVSNNLQSIGGNQRHQYSFRALASGIGFITFTWRNFNNPQQQFLTEYRVNIQNGDCIDICGIEPHECCPSNSYYDGINCYYGAAPNGFVPEMLNNQFAVRPSNGRCPPGYAFDGTLCLSGINVPDGYTPSIYDDKFYVFPQCGDLRDCCPSGWYFDGANCYSGVAAPEGYVPFIYGSRFYVEPNCNISTDNNCCPVGYTFDGFNCASGLTFPEDFIGFIYGNGFYAEPYCYDTLDCCPVGTTLDAEDRCVYGLIPAGYSGFVYGNRFYVDSQNNNCPNGYELDKIGCYSGISFPSDFEGGGQTTSSMFRESVPKQTIVVL